LLSLKEALSRTVSTLQPHSNSARLDAQLLLLFCLTISREKLLTHSDRLLTEREEKALRTVVQRRISGEPMAYILGHQEFWSLDFKVSQDTLIPRPETESLVEWILEHFPQEKLMLADLGTGSGAIAIALAFEQPHWEIHASDLSEGALKIAQFNAEKLVPHRVQFFQGRWCKALPQKNYNLLVSNPPYIRAKDPHLKALEFEPFSALVSGEDGLDSIQTIASEARDYLQAHGCLVLEHGFDQSHDVVKILEDFGYNEVEAHPDLGGTMRFVVGFA
jgi:release factor glutamine methyltransferase